MEPILPISRKPFLQFVENPFSLLDVIKKKEFKQLYRIENDMRTGNMICFTDDVENPNVIFAICRVRGKLSLYAQDMNKLEEFLKQENWANGFLRQYNKISIDANERFQKGVIVHSTESIKHLGFASIEPHIADILIKHLTQQGFEATCKVYGFFNALTINVNDSMIESLKKNLDGNECELSVEDAAIVNENWKYKDANTLQFMEWSCSKNISTGYKVEGKLVSWIVMATDGSLANLFTLPEYRGKQFARKVVSKLIINLYSKGVTVPYLYIKDDNEASHALFKSLGFNIDDILVQWADFIQQ